MKKYLLAIFFSFNLIIISLAQTNLYMPIEFQKSYSKGFRNYDGSPGKNYFINYAKYKIDANFFPQQNKLSATETIIYINNSKDTLSKIVVKLYSNLYKKGAPRDFPIPESDLTEGMIIKEAKIRNKSLDVEKLKEHATFLYLPLQQKLLPGDSIKLYFSWELKLPEKMAMRYGRYASRTYFVGYWYPQIAVYDDIFGWEKSPHTGVQEFYNDHSDYDVNITVPFPNLVWATGKLQNASQVLKKTYYQKYKIALHSKEVVHIVTAEDLKNKEILKNSKKNTWHFKAKQVPSFAFATSDQHNWDAVSLSIPDKAEPVLISAVYADSSKIYHSLADASKKIISYYSFKKPQIFFPYTAMTVFEGGGAMEHPMMVNMGDMEKPCLFHYVLAHEIGHTYFPFYTGTNEKKYAWMDEGLMSYFPRIVTDEIWTKCSNTNIIKTKYTEMAGSVFDLPPMIPSSIYHDFFAYRNIAYNRPGFAFYILNQTLGDSLFYTALQQYVKRWAHKHPYPYDFFFTFNNITNQNLNWFWKPYFFEFATADLEISDYNYNNADLFIRIKNKGGLPLPVKIQVILEDGKTVDFSKNADCWKNSNHLDISISIEKKPVKIILGSKDIPDIDPSNNIINF